MLVPCDVSSPSAVITDTTLTITLTSLLLCCCVPAVIDIEDNRVSLMVADGGYVRSVSLRTASALLQRDCVLLFATSFSSSFASRTGHALHNDWLLLLHSFPPLTSHCALPGHNHASLPFHHLSRRSPSLLYHFPITSPPLPSQVLHPYFHLPSMHRRGQVTSASVPTQVRHYFIVQLCISFHILMFISHYVALYDSGDAQTNSSHNYLFAHYFYSQLLSPTGIVFLQLSMLFT